MVWVVMVVWFGIVGEAFRKNLNFLETCIAGV